MLRIADANCIALQELMFGFQSCYPDVLCPNSLDRGFSTAFLKAMARFCRAPAGTLRSLDLRSRFPKAQKVLLLHLRAGSDECLRCRKERVGYAFCPTCIGQHATCTLVGSGPSLPCSFVMFTRARSDTVVQCVAKTTHFPLALRPFRQFAAGAAERI
jgi:hypothetical protein